MQSQAEDNWTPSPCPMETERSGVDDFNLHQEEGFEAFETEVALRHLSQLPPALTKVQGLCYKCVISYHQGFFLKPFLKGKILRSSERGVNSILTTILRF